MGSKRSKTKPEPEQAVDAENEAPPKVSRHIQPVGPRVLVRIVKGPDRSESGLFLPQGVKEASVSALLGEVVEVARTLPKNDALNDDDDDHDDDIDPDDDDAEAFGKNVSGIPLGSNVLFGKERGVAVPWDETLRLLEVRHVLAIVDIISQDELQ